MADVGIDESKEKEFLPKSSTETIGRILGESDAAEDSPKKRRRTAKPNSEKKFECKHEGCGKSYSRAEHLYRHQLNHTPKTIYRCDYPDCNRYFVRQDLCVRHRERHTTHGSQLHKRDSFAQASATQAAVDNSDGSRKENEAMPVVSPTRNASNPVFDTPDEIGAVQAAVHRSRYTGNAISPLSSDHNYQTPTSHNGFSRPSLPIQRRASLATSPSSPDQASVTTWTSQAVRRDSYSHGDNRQNNYYAMNSNHRRGISQTVPPSPVRTLSDNTSSSATIRAPQSESYVNGDRNSPFVTSAQMGNNNFSTAAFPQTAVQHNPHEMFSDGGAPPWNQSGNEVFHYPGMNTSIQPMDWSTAYGFPMFGGEDFNRSPFALADEFAAWLFSDNQSASTGFSPNNVMPPQGEHAMSQFPGTFFSQSPNSVANVTSNMYHNSHPNVASATNGQSATSFMMSEEKRQELLDIMQNQFIERPHDAVKKRKDAVFEGDIDADDHILSLRMTHTYINSYWYHQHAQLPILHKPTFVADKQPNLLLLAIIAIGAATLDKAYGTAFTDSAAEFANFVVWHLRWEIIRDADFRPPAKLWVFQTLLLIEVYEKMYATRALHERAHIHHDSTLTLMRRGSSLIGRSANDTPPNGPMGDLLRKATESGHPVEVTKSEDSWNRWITAEATRRVAFAAFVIDSIHCTMFGHSAKMVAHELRLPLPCDEGMWSATSPAEVGRVQSLLQTNGIKATMFLEGLKKTLNGQRVRTNSFGRTIIMSGLLSVSWHMTQRDVQISALGPRASAFAGRDNWKGVLLRAFDNWKRDFDEALAEATPSSPTRIGNSSANTSVVRSLDEENIFESRTVLHHLAHIAAHADIIDCQVFAGANRLLSRSVTSKDYSIIREKIERWATKASARDSAFYALKFIAQVLVPPDQIDSEGNTIDGRIYGHASPILPQAFDHNQYIARDDFLLNRPWILYISALVVWCYGFALEGPIQPPPRDDEFQTYEQRERDMRSFLDRVAGVRAPDDLEAVHGKNRCLGLLLILKDSFASTRWELTHEAANLLGNAINKLKGHGQSEAMYSRTYNRTAQNSAITNGYTDVVADMK